jgi:hypothetical protein
MNECYSGPTKGSAVQTPGTPDPNGSPASQVAGDSRTRTPQRSRGTLPQPTSQTPSSRYGNGFGSLAPQQAAAVVVPFSRNALPAILFVVSAGHYVRKCRDCVTSGHFIREVFHGKERPVCKHATCRTRAFVTVGGKSCSSRFIDKTMK